jgi:hypothetical protein
MTFKALPLIIPIKIFTSFIKLAVSAFQKLSSKNPSNELRLIIESLVMATLLLFLIWEMPNDLFDEHLLPQFEIFRDLQEWSPNSWTHKRNL